MKKNIFTTSAAFAAILALGTFAFAQHGRPAGAGGGMGGGMGADMGGGGGMGRPSGTGSGMERMGGNPAISNMGSQSPSAVLSNSHVNTALTNALGKSGISVPGGNLQSACGGFKSLGQCVAAMHVAKNLNLNFSDFQNLMSGPNGESLGKAIQGLGGPNVNSKSEAKKANKQAGHDLNTAASAYKPSAS